MRFYIHKLGCPKNDVDADYIAGRLIDSGHEPVDEPERADSIIVNTCGFITSAKEESINEILRLSRLKGEGAARSLYATGCLTQRFGDELLSGMPELDGAFGHGALNSIAEAVSESKRLGQTIKMETRTLAYLTWKHRHISDGLPYSYLKISDGCDRPCTYCAIPQMRGRFRSRPIESILREAEYLAANGKRELILVSQEATMYGYGLKDSPTVIDLLRELEKVDGIEWIRLMYLYPTQVTPQLIDLMDSSEKVLSYFDLPLQHINTDILRRMKRFGTREEIERLLHHVRRIAPGATIRTTFIVGFPGETEAQFEELETFVGEFEFDRLGVFEYSPEEDTPAAAYDQQVPEEVKAERMDRIMTVQREIAFTKNQGRVGHIEPVIVDTINESGVAIGRSQGDCPEIDQEIYVHAPGLKVGDIVMVRYDSSDGYDLHGTFARG